MIEKGRKEDGVKDEIANTRKILVVEDDEVLSRLIAKCLRKTDFDVAVANSGAQALDWIAGNPTDLVHLPYKLWLIGLYLGIFITAEAAFILMAIKEYLQDLVGLKEIDLIVGPYKR